MKELEVCYGEGDEWKLAPESHGTEACMAAFFVAEGLYLPDPFLQQRGSPKNVPWAPEAHLRCPAAGICLWVLLITNVTSRPDLNLCALLMHCQEMPEASCLAQVVQWATQ